MALCAERKVRVAAARALPISRLGRELLAATSVAAGCFALEARRATRKVVCAARGALPVTGLRATVRVAWGPLLLLELVAAVVSVPAVRLAIVLERVVLLLLAAVLLLIVLALHTQVATIQASSIQSHPRIETKSKNHVSIWYNIEINFEPETIHLSRQRVPRE